MAVINFHLASAAEAEDAIADIWVCLEEYGIPSPGLTFSFPDASCVSIALRVDDAVAARLLMLRLGNWLTLRSRRLGDALEIEAARCAHRRSHGASTGDPGGGRAAEPRRRVAARLDRMTLRPQ